MGDDADQLRARAKECRDRAERADYVMQQFLIQVAEDLDKEADKMDAEKRGQQRDS